MFKNLAPGAVGVGGPIEELAPLAQNHGFEGIDLDAGKAADLLEAGQLDSLERLYETHGLRPGGVGLPVDFRRGEAAFEEGLAGLGRIAKAAAAMGCRGCCTWLAPASNELPFDENFELHRRRLGACAEVLGGHGLWLGLEFVGPTTSRAGKAHEFIWNMAGVLKLADAIGTGNVGLLFDCWHWYTSRGTVDEILALRPEQVVNVHVNDAPAGIPVDEQIDSVREMPGATGVVDISSFLGALAEIGYDGPITPEPFNKELREMPREEALAATAASLDAILPQAGLA